MRILYLEDDRDSRELMVVLLGQRGYEVISTATLAEGLRLAKEEHFDLIILDNWLDQGTGIDACERIRNYDKETPILFYSAAAYQSDIDRAIKAGAQGYLIKPAVQELEEAVVRLLSK